MDQSRALNALAPFIALAKSATSPRAAADLINQATSAQNTYVFAELLQQPNIQQLKGQEQYGASYELLKIFAWGTWDDYKGMLHSRFTTVRHTTANLLLLGTEGLPELSDTQALKLRLLSLLSFASEKATSSNLSYSSLCTRLDLSSPIDLEHLVTQAIYSNLLTGTLNPASQTVVITSVSPLRDLAPGSITTMMAELQAWSTRCDGVLDDLEAEIARVKGEAQKRHAREQKAEKQVKAVMDAGEKKGGGGVLDASRSGHNTRGAVRKEQDDDDEDLMELDNGAGVIGGGRKKTGGGGGIGGLMGRFGGGGRSGGR